MTKKKIQKILAVMFAFVFVLSAFTACGKKDKNEPSSAPTEGTTEPTTEDDFSIPPIEDDETTKVAEKENDTSAAQGTVKPTQSTVKPTQSNVKPTEKPTQSATKPTQTPKPTQAPTEASKNVYKTAYFTTSTGEKIQYTSYSYNAEFNDERTYKAYEKNGIVYTVDNEGAESPIAVQCPTCHSYANCKCDPYVCDKCGKHNCHEQTNGGNCYLCGKALKPGECHECPKAPVRVCPHCGKKVQM